jgi:hypothetical protein
MALTQDQRRAIGQRVLAHIGDMLNKGYEATAIAVPELNEIWTISRENGDVT